ncbi:saccharopine dehydrogenase NADP-binding domain-containing protein [Pseudomonas sp. ZM23]|uniref:Saccharopine dehydrogenase NADP-binding domain-containing protein n=1 Tax=Pseudomonas triclosanedens TaxID=2961893 RepID=A0ABY7A597_9PSED|nr:saccharopine dehydrogenase NADP-binding domain-containing protein [Pseudomonas triclosanedens]MCP8465546.1 saccharopine dehydrogenase NADP-binding domain-containing protein [Pseudomonas triclosanedens]MCP8471041.1 saccharopine dehydrogenase NADP-binding domain-containing protein [Pseudomonas triclosanedens]MCP8476845.1 saccharopine dehydrogenase NADP-binding domain-containing protein [Pseudomonas triclosanedens]WAI52040.1 saccharopine dehydrogenase NADP-binding domain-containing protein [Pse
MSVSVEPTFRVLVLGGYGNFGSLIVRRLSGIDGIRVLVGGRDQKRASELAREVGGEAVCLDMNQPTLSGRLVELKVNLVISTAGPFQGQDYRVARAAIGARAHYIDLADARAFVCGVTELDRAARSAGVLVCSGASSVPALSAAVIDQLLPRFQRLDSIHHGISSSAKIPGVATLAAVLGYCGKPVRQWRDGQWQVVHGWQGLSVHDFPRPLGRRWVAHCDVPDLELFAQRYPGVREVRFSAGLGLRLTQLGTWGLSWLVRGRLLKNAALLSNGLHRLGVALQPFGDGRSGMFVQLRGVDETGRSLALCWELIALDDHGPNIPCMAAVALARKLASGQLRQRGAMPCVGLVSVDDYLAELDGLKVSHGVRDVAGH